jgi:protein-L-isoaspartate O-methyltransferase
MITRRDVHLNLDLRPTHEILSGLVHYGDKSKEGFEHACYYHAYSAVARIVRPKAVLEIGVRRGYALAAMLRGFSGIQHIVGIDTEGWVARSQALAFENLRAIGYTGTLDLPVVSSRGFSDRLGAAQFDIVHVDGDHSYESAVSDIFEYWPSVVSGGVMIVDDLQQFDVMRALVDALPKLLKLSSSFYFPTGTGWRILVKE